MTEKPSLYGLRGLNDKASPEQIQQAYESCRQALESQPESEEKHNRLAILHDARDVLNDRRQRAGYDRRQRDRRHAMDTPPPTRSRWPALVLLLMLGAAYPAWRHLAAERPVAAVKALPVAEPVAENVVERPAISADIAALLPATPPAEAAPPAAPKPAVTAPQSRPKLAFDGPNTAIMAKFSDSTYLIIGAAGLGTGVAIDHDKLLTNCHVIAPNVLKGPILAINPTTQEKTRITAAAFLIKEDACVVHAPGLNGQPIAIGDAGRLARGARIFNIGFANGRLMASAGTLLGIINRSGQNYLVSSNYCDHGVSGGPLVDEEGRLVGLTSGGPLDRSFCLSLTAETARTVLAQTLIAIDAFPPNYLSNLQRRW